MIEQLAEQTYEFLKVFGRIETGEKPIIRQMELRCPEINQVHPHHRHMYDDSEYNLVKESIPRLTKRIDSMDEIIEKIPDGITVIETGSFFGEGFSIPLSKQNPNSKIYAVDMFNDSFFLGISQYTWALHSEKPTLDIVKLIGKELGAEDNLEYVNRKITEENGFDFANPDSPLLVAGFFNSRELPYLVAKHSIDKKADAVILTQSAVHDINPGDIGFFPKSEYFLGKIDNKEKIQTNLKNLINSIKNIYGDIQNNRFVSDEQSMIYGPMIKQLFALDLAMYLKQHGYTPAVFNYSKKELSDDYLVFETKKSIKIMEKLGFEYPEMYKILKDVKQLKSNRHLFKHGYFNHSQHILYACKDNDILELN